MYAHDAFTQKKSYLMSNANKKIYINNIKLSQALATDPVMKSAKENWSPLLSTAETIKSLGAALIWTRDASRNTEKAYLR